MKIKQLVELLSKQNQEEDMVLRSESGCFWRVNEDKTGKMEAKRDLSKQTYTLWIN